MLSGLHSRYLLKSYLGCDDSPRVFEVTDIATINDGGDDGDELESGRVVHGTTRSKPITGRIGLSCYWGDDGCIRSLDKQREAHLLKGEKHVI